MELKTVRKRAEVVFRDDSVLTGHFFVATLSPLHDGSQTMAELLNGERGFLPLEIRAGETVLVQKNAIALVRIGERDQIVPAALARSIPVTVCLLSGQSLEGTVRNDLPSDYSRLSDFFNHSLPFFVLEEPGGDCLVNLDAVRSVRSGAGE